MTYDLLPAGSWQLLVLCRGAFSIDAGCVLWVCYALWVLLRAGPRPLAWAAGISRGRTVNGN
jgi:hypothetical protein